MVEALDELSDLVLFEGFLHEREELGVIGRLSV